MGSGATHFHWDEIVPTGDEKPDRRTIPGKSGDLKRIVVKAGTVAAEHQQSLSSGFAPSGNNELDELLGGGLERGTNALLIGAAGVGKSSVALTYAIAAAERLTFSTNRKSTPLTCCSSANSATSVCR